MNLQGAVAVVTGGARGIGRALAARLENERDLDGATRWARWAAARGPDDERAVRRLMELLSRLGDRAGAIRAYEEFARHLDREYEAEPSAETQNLITSVRAGDPATAPLDTSPSAHAAPAPERTRLDGLRAAMTSWAA